LNTVGDNPEIKPFLRNFTFVEAAVLVVVGFGLFFFPQYLRPLWAWEIAPSNAPFLVAIYIRALVPVSLMYLSGRWSPTRLVLRAIFTFTLIVLIVSLYHIDRFNFSKWQVWIWFGLYIALPASGGYHLWIYRAMANDHLPITGQFWRITTQASGVAFAVYGLGLITAPDTFSSLFPWRLDVFHSQLYSATFLTGCVLMLTVSVRATRAEFFATGVTESAFGIFSILGLVIVDHRVQKIDWTASNTIAWLALLGVITVLGLTMIAMSFRNRNLEG